MKSATKSLYNEGYQLLEVRIGTVSGGVKTVDVDARERYLWDLSYVDAPAMVELDTNLDGTRDYRLWPTFDANFNVTGLLTDQGVTVERYAYTPYGERIVLNGDQNYANSGADPDGAEWTVDTNGSDFGMLVGFQGLRYDPETGNWYSYRFVRRYLRRRGVRPLIPRRKDQQHEPGRRPWFDREQYKCRNVIERCVNKLKQFRCVATRYDKLASSYLAQVQLAMIKLTLRELRDTA